MKLVGEFVDSVAKQNQAIHSGTTKEVRYDGNKMVAAARKLVSGDEGRRQFATLFDHPDREVRANTACYLRDYMPDEALRVFKELAEGEDLIAKAARMRAEELEQQHKR